MAEVDFPLSLRGRRTEGNRVSPERFPDLKTATPEGDLAVRIYLAHLVARTILHWRKLFRIGPVGDLITAGWHLHSDPLMRALAVVDPAPVSEPPPAGLQAREVLEPQDFCLQGAIEPLVFAVSLRMTPRREANLDS